MGGTEYVSFELFLGILSGPGEGRGGAPGTVPLQNPEVTSRKACLRNAESFVQNSLCRRATLTTDVKRMNANRAIRIAAQRTQGL